MRRPISKLWVHAGLLLLLLVLQGQLWLGRGSLPTTWQMQRKLEAAQDKLAQAQQLHERLLAEVKDLQEGLDLVEEKARFELGMLKPGEIYVQWVD